jgi:hypothetical protein
MHQALGAQGAFENHTRALGGNDGIKAQRPVDDGMDALHCACHRSRVLDVALDDLEGEAPNS